MKLASVDSSTCPEVAPCATRNFGQVHVPVVLWLSRPPDRNPWQPGFADMHREAMELAERTRQGWEACEERAAVADAAAVTASRDLAAAHAASDQLREDLQVMPAQLPRTAHAGCA